MLQPLGVSPHEGQGRLQLVGGGAHKVLPPLLQCPLVIPAGLQLRSHPPQVPVQIADLVPAADAALQPLEVQPCHPAEVRLGLFQGAHHDFSDDPGKQQAQYRRQDQKAEQDAQMLPQSALQRCGDQKYLHREAEVRLFFVVLGGEAGGIALQDRAFPLMQRLGGGQAVDMTAHGVHHLRTGAVKETGAEKIGVLLQRLAALAEEVGVLAACSVIGEACIPDGDGIRPKKAVSQIRVPHRPDGGRSAAAVDQLRDRIEIVGGVILQKNQILVVPRLSLRGALDLNADQGLCPDRPAVIVRADGPDDRALGIAAGPAAVFLGKQHFAAPLSGLLDPMVPLVEAVVVSNRINAAILHDHIRTALGLVILRLHDLLRRTHHQNRAHRRPHEEHHQNGAQGQLPGKGKANISHLRPSVPPRR